MTGRVVLTLILAAGCAAAVPVAHGSFAGEGGHGSAGGAAGGSDGHGFASHFRGHHGGPVADCPGPDAMEARLRAALDALGLAADTRAKVEAVLDAHFDEARALIARLHSGEIDREAALVEHEEIVASAKAGLAEFLTPDEIRRLHDALHPQASAAGR